jgi:glutamine synthetase
MVGSSQSIAGPNTALNTIMAEELKQFADILETADNFDEALHELVAKTFTEHQRILFDGNGYSEEWTQEAARRGLSNLPSTAECLPTYILQKNIDLVMRHGIFTEAEFRARYSIYLEAYNKVIGIEARTMVDMALHQILPAALRYTKELCGTMSLKKELGVTFRAESDLVQKLSGTTDALYDAIQSLNASLASVPGDAESAATYYHSTIVPAMVTLRSHADTLETLTDKSYWPYPTYSDLLFY